MSVSAAAGGVSAPEDRWLAAARWSAVAIAASIIVSPPLANLAMALTVAFLLASGQARIRFARALRQPVAIGAILVLAVVAVAMLWAQVPWKLRLDSLWSWRKLLLLLVLLALFGPLRWKMRLIWGYLAACAVGLFVSFGLVAVAGRLPEGPHPVSADPTVHEKLAALAGTLLRHHVMQALSFAVAATLCLWLALDRSLAPRRRALAGALGALFLVNLAFVTPGRSGYLALAAMLAALAVFGVRSVRAALWALLGAALVAGLLAASPLVRGGLERGVTEWRNAASLPEYNSMGYRAVVYENSLEIVRERPWLGVGTGGFGDAYARHIEGKYTGWRAIPSVDPHSQYLFFLAEQGAVGLAAFLVFLGLAFADRGDGTRTRLVAVAVLAGWCASGLLTSHFKTFAEGHLLAIFLGAMLARPMPGESA